MAHRLVHARYLWRPKLLARTSAPSCWEPFLALFVLRSSPCAGEVCVAHRIV
jgi:hypothetical protein